MSGHRDQGDVRSADVSAETAREGWRMMQQLILNGEARGRMQTACDMTGVPPGVLKTLVHLAPDVPTPMRDIATFFGVDSSYVTSLVDDLEANGLAERRPHPTDRRVKTIVLTPKGIEARERIHELMWEPPGCFAALSDAEQAQLLRLLRKLTDADPMLKGSTDS